MLLGLLTSLLRLPDALIDDVLRVGVDFEWQILRIYNMLIFYGQPLGDGLKQSPVAVNKAVSLRQQSKLINDKLRAAAGL